jgi:hypothetical protein
MNEELRTEIEQLRCQKTKALKLRYLELFGEASKSSNHAHLFRRVAWRLRALSEGDLGQRARGRASASISGCERRASFGRRWPPSREGRFAIRSSWPKEQSCSGGIRIGRSL